MGIYSVLKNKPNTNSIRFENMCQIRISLFCLNYLNTELFAHLCFVNVVHMLMYCQKRCSNISINWNVVKSKINAAKFKHSSLEIETLPVDIYETNYIQQVCLFSLNISSKHATRKCLKSLEFLLSQYCKRKYLSLVHLHPQCSVGKYLLGETPPSYIIPLSPSLLSSP